MRHYKKGRKLGTDASHTKAMKRSLVAALFENDRIKTTEERAKEIRSDVDRVITWAKKGDLHSRRLAMNKVGDQEMVREVFEKAAQGMWADRNGGYTRIMKLGPRKGDAARVVIMELVTEPCVPKEKTKKDDEKKGAAKSAAKTAKAEAEKEAVEASEEAAEAVEAAEEAEEAEVVAEEADEADKPAAEEAAAEAEAEAEKEAVEASEEAAEAVAAAEEAEETEETEESAEEAEDVSEEEADA
jgi:large subunit ribosomal protein L17